MKHIVSYLLLSLAIPCVATANIENNISDAPDSAVTYDDILNRAPDQTECATGVFANALKNAAPQVNESDDESVIENWIHKTFSDKSVLQSVLACPEIANVADDTTIKFLPIKYTFPGGREIIVNYETQPKIFKQRILMADKKAMPSSDPNPRLSSADGIVWTNTDPAWYAIMVTEHGALNEFVGPDKNNTISMQYIADNINSFYPNAATNGGNCTSRSALAGDSNAINRAVTQTVNLQDGDSNDYYVAGDINLRWISYLEIAADVALTVASYGGWTAVSGATKATRAVNVMRKMVPTLKTLSKSDDVVKWVKATNQATKLADEIKTLDKVADAAKIAEKTKELESINKTIKTLEKTKDVAAYKDTSKTFSELNTLRKTIKGAGTALKTAQRGNVIARAGRAFKGIRTIRASKKANKLINHGAKLARSSTFSGQARDWLFHTTLKHADGIARMGANTGLLYGAIKFVGGMYDWTETSTDEYTSGLEFAPLLLLSADDIPEAGNVVNHGMWLMWAGDSTSAADDDAAYLQAMDFAAKFHQDLIEIQDGGNSPCNVDIYVARPILRNPGTEYAELYYLIMNDEPWTTATD